LGQIGHPAIAPQLLAALQDADAEVRQNAAIALGNMPFAFEPQPHPM
jgi:HEAT repeat protein